MLAIPGTADPTHLEQNIAAGALTLTPEDLKTLASLCPLTPTPVCSLR